MQPKHGKFPEFFFKHSLGSSEIGICAAGGQIVQNEDEYNDQQTAVVEGPVLKTGTSVRFQIITSAYFGIVIRDVVAKNKFKLKNFKLGHGYFVISDGGVTLSHSHKEHNDIVQKGFVANEKDTVLVTVTEHQISFKNQNTNQEFKMEIALTEDEWKSVHFCARLASQYQRIKIL